MPSMLKKIFAPLALAGAVLGLAGCENAQDIAAKPAVIQQMVDNSLSVCQTGPINSAPAQYSQRMSNMLSGVRTDHLKTLQSHHVTICLDQRLQDQKPGDGFWDARTEGVFYPAKDGGGIMTYRDNGKQPAEETFWHGNPLNYYGSSATGALARHIENSDLPPGMLKAEIYGSKSHYAEWNTVKSGKGVIAANPQLVQPPVKAPGVKPAS